MSLSWLFLGFYDDDFVETCQVDLVCRLLLFQLVFILSHSVSVRSFSLLIFQPNIDLFSFPLRVDAVFIKCKCLHFSSKKIFLGKNMSGKRGAPRWQFP